MNVFSTRLLLVLLLPLLSSTVEAQVIPGYMGRRLFLEAGTTLGGLGDGDDLAIFPFSASLDASIHYVFKRSMSVKAGYSYASLYNDRVGNQVLYYRPTRYADYSVDYTTILHDVHLGIDFYLYPKQKFAPHNWFIGLGIRGVYNVSSAQSEVGALPDFPSLVAPPSFFFVGVEFSYGYRAVIADRFLLSFNAQHAVFPTAFGHTGSSTLVYTTPDYQNTNTYASTIKSTINKRYSIMLRLSLGVFLTR